VLAVERASIPTIRASPPLQMHYTINPKVGTEVWLDPGVHCVDSDGIDITDADLDISMGNMEQPGTHTVKYTCKNAKGVSANPVNREVISVMGTNDMPRIKVTPPIRMRYQINHNFKDPGAHCFDADGTDITSASLLMSLPEVDSPGTYTIKYVLLCSTTVVLRQVIIGMRHTHATRFDLSCPLPKAMCEHLVQTDGCY
jgi:hypothetical protein